MLVKIRTNKKTRNKSKKYIAFIIKNMYNKFTKNIILVKKGEGWKIISIISNPDLRFGKGMG